MKTKKNKVDSLKKLRLRRKLLKIEQAEIKRQLTTNVDEAKIISQMGLLRLSAITGLAAISIPVFNRLNQKLKEEPLGAAIIEMLSHAFMPSYKKAS